MAEVAKHLKSLAAVAKELDRKAGVVASEVGGLRAEMGGLKAEMGGLRAEMGGVKAEMGGLKAQGRQTAVQLGRVMPLVEERDRRETTRLSGFSWVHDK